jgi:hypothetical protein
LQFPSHIQQAFPFQTTHKNAISINFNYKWNTNAAILHKGLSEEVKDFYNLDVFEAIQGLSFEVHGQGDFLGYKSCLEFEDTMECSGLRASRSETGFLPLNSLSISVSRQTAVELFGELSCSRKEHAITKPVHTQAEKKKFSKFLRRLILRNGLWSGTNIIPDISLE